MSQANPPPMDMRSTRELARPQHIVMLVEQIQNLIVLVSLLGVAMIGAGFVVVNSHLWRYTRQHGYALNPNRYLTAGVMLLLFLVALFIGLYVVMTLLDNLDRSNDIRSRRWRWFWPFWGGTLLAVGALTQAMFGLMHSTVLAMMTVILVLLGKQVGRALGKPLARSSAIVWGGLFVYALMAGFLFGRSMYWRIPHSLGGGQPPIVQLVFEDDRIAQALQIPLADGVFSTLADLQLPQTSTTITERLCMLSETRDGVLVYDPRRRVTLSVRYDDILSIRDVYRTSEQLAQDQKTFNCAPPGVSGDLLADVSGLLAGSDAPAPATLTP